MARTIEVTEAGELDGFADVADAVSGYVYRFARTPKGDSHVLGELRPSSPDHAIAAQVLFGIGSGTMDRSYVLGHGAGMWFAPVEVLTLPEGRQAVLAPHADMHSGSRFSVPITGECLGCHTDDPPPRSFPLNLRQGQGDWQPRGISCAACHRNSDEHAQWQEADGSGGQAEGRDPLVMHGDLDRFQQLSICAACHLQGDARLVLDGPALGPPQPGGDLLQSRAVFVSAEESNEVGFVSQVERLVLSECFLQSEMTCSSCHDPHESLSAPGERERVRGACLSCHVSDGDSGELVMEAGDCSRVHAEAKDKSNTESDCVSCHMPRTGAFDVARVTIHDHFIRTDISDAMGAQVPENLHALASPVASWKRFEWPGASRPEHYGERGLWMMAYASVGQVELARALVDVEPGSHAFELPMYHHVRAGILKSMGRLEEASQAYGRALELDPDLVESAINLGLLLGELGRMAAGLDLLSQVIERYPYAWSALRNRAVLLSRMGRIDEAKADLIRAFQALPSPEVAQGLSALFRAEGDSVGEQRWLQLAEELDPRPR